MEEEEVTGLMHQLASSWEVTLDCSWCLVAGPVYVPANIRRSINLPQLSITLNTMFIRMEWSNSSRCDNYRSIRNAIKLTKCQEMLWSKPLWGQFWPNLCYEAGHKWTQPTLQCVDCAVCIGRHNCRHYNWLAAVSVLGCLQKQRKTLLSPIAF